MQPNRKPNERKRGKQPFCWIEKPKLRMIEDVFSENTGLGSIEAARSIYLAMAEIASDNECDTFEASQAAIARRADVSVSTLKRILPVFARLGFVKIRHKSVNKMKTRSTYTLVRGELSIAAGELSIVQTPKKIWPISEECSEEHHEVSARKKVKGVNDTGDSSLAEKGDGWNEKTGEYEF